MSTKSKTTAKNNIDKSEGDWRPHKREAERKHAEALLRQSENKYETLYQHMSVGVIYQNADGKVVDANPAAKRILGAGLDQISDLASIRANLKTIHEDGTDFPAEEHPSMVSLKTGKPLHNQLMGVYFPNEENYHWININTVPQFKPGEKKPYQVFVTFDDITERKQTEEALRVSEARYHSLVEAQTEVIARSDLSGHLTFVNGAYTRMFGISQDELIGKSFLPTVLPEDLPISTEALSKIQSPPYRCSTETRHVTPNGIRWIAWENSAVLDSRGKIIEFQGTGRDVTERKQTEKALLESEMRFRRAVEAAGAIPYFHDYKTNTYSFIGEGIASLTGYSAQEITPPLFGSLEQDAHMLGGESSISVKEAAALMRNGRLPHWRCDSLVTAKDGKKHWVADTSVPIFLETGEVAGSIGFLQDITERKQAEEKIERQNQRLKTLREIDSAILASDSVESIVGAALSHIRELIDCHRAGMALIDWEANEAVIFNVKTAGETSVAKGSRVPLTLLQAMPQAMSKPLANNQPVLIHDLTEEPDLPPLLQILRNEGLRSVCILPLFSQGSQMGTFNLLSEIPGFFDDEKIVLGREVANQVAIAITQSRLIESTRESEERFSTAFHSSPNAITISRVVDGQFIDVNNAACQLFGYSREELIGHRSLDLGLTNAETRQKIINVLTTQGKIQDFEITISAHGGIQRDILESMETIRVRGEQCILTNIIDITERKRAEEALRKSEERYRTVADYTYDWEYWRAPDGRILYIAPSCERVTGYRAEEFIANPGLLETIMHPDDRFLLEQHKLLIQQDGKDPGVHKMEYRIIRKDGEIRWIGHLCQLIYRDDGTSLGRRATNRDITENRLAEEEIRRLNIELEERVIQRTAQLETVNKELESFAYSVSHDLRAPLRAITGYTNILLEDYEPSFDAEGKRVCGVISSEAQRMGLLIDDLLAFSRLSRTEMHNSKIDMKKMIQAVFNEITTPESRERIDLQVGALPSVVGDTSLIRQVWINLLANAIKFTSKKERAVIQVESTQNGDEVIYSVRDNGAGFDMQYADKLFGVFQRLHSEHEFEGTGVGLAIVHRVILRHGGRIWAEGQVGNGAVFHFALPKKEESYE